MLKRILNKAITLASGDKAVAQAILQAENDISAARAQQTPLLQADAFMRVRDKINDSFLHILPAKMLVQKIGIIAACAAGAASLAATAPTVLALSNPIATGLLAFAGLRLSLTLATSVYKWPELMRDLYNHRTALEETCSTETARLEKRHPGLLRQTPAAQGMNCNDLSALFNTSIYTPQELETKYAATLRYAHKTLGK